MKGDIRKFFASIDHKTLIQILGKYIEDQKIIVLLRQIIESFKTIPGEGLFHSKSGLPLGNLTSQLLGNIYMNEFDQFIKKELKIKYYIRYADDFVFFFANREYLISLIQKFKKFLLTNLKLEIHPKKLYIKTLASGVDFLGWVNFPDHRVLRTATKRRMQKRIKEDPTSETLASYVALLSHGNAHKLSKKFINIDW